MFHRSGGSLFSDFGGKKKISGCDYTCWCTCTQSIYLVHLSGSTSTSCHDHLVCMVSSVLMKCGNTTISFCVFLSLCVLCIVYILCHAVYIYIYFFFLPVYRVCFGEGSVQETWNQVGVAWRLARPTCPLYAKENTVMDDRYHIIVIIIMTPANVKVFILNHRSHKFKVTG